MWRSYGHPTRFSPMKRFRLRRLLTLSAFFGTLSAPAVSTTHGYAHAHPAGDHSSFHEVSQHTGTLAVPGISPLRSESDHEVLHADCTLGQPRGRTVAISISALIATPDPAGYSLAPVRQDPKAELPTRHQLIFAFAPLHARAPPAR